MRALLAGGPGLDLERRERASSSLLDDLRSDEGMGWVPGADAPWLPGTVLVALAGVVGTLAAVGRRRASAA